MKIIHVCKKYPNALGGDAVVVSNMQKQQKAKGHKTIILTSKCTQIKDREDIYKLGINANATSLDAITLKRLVSLIVLFFRAFSILRAEKPDIIHTHSVDMAFFISFAARHYKIPIIHTFHIVTFYDHNQSVLRRKTELFLIGKTKPKLITAPNHYDAEKLIAAGLKNVSLLPNGVDITYWRRTERKKKNKTYTFIAAGRLETQKGYEYLIKATACLVEKYGLKPKVVIIGEGSLREPLIKQARSLQISSHVKFLGNRTPTSIRSLLSRADCSICPSLYETTPLSLLEAWSVGIPCISTPVGILKTTDSPAALMTKIKDPEHLALSMKKIMSDPALSKSLIQTGKRQAKRYAWPTISDQLESMYGQII